MKKIILILTVLSGNIILQGAEKALEAPSSSEHPIFLDPLAEVSSVILKTHTLLNKPLPLDKEQQKRCNSLREAWYGYVTFLTPGFEGQFKKDVEHNFSKCGLKVKTPNLFGLLGLDHNADVTHESFSFFKNTLDAAGKFKDKPSDTESLISLRTNFPLIYTKLAAQHPEGLFTGISHDTFLSTLQLEKPDLESYEKMSKLLRQADYFARNPYSFDLYQAFTHSPETFKELLTKYHTALKSFGLDTDKIETIQNTLLAVKENDMDCPGADIEVSRIYTQLEADHPAFLSRFRTDSTRLVRSLGVAALQKIKGLKDTDSQ